MVTKKQQKIDERKALKLKDKTWAMRVKRNFHNKCAFCEKTKYIQAHHIIPREIKKFRHWEMNGIALCPSHHKWGMTSAHANPLRFYMDLEIMFPLKIKFLKVKYKEYLITNE